MARTDHRDNAADGADSLTPPWEQRRLAKRPAPKRKPLTLQTIIDGALAVLDREGLEVLSMRKVAAEVGVAVSALYAHVRDKDELLQVMYEHVYTRFSVPDPDPDNWQEQVRELARQLRRLLLSHRDMARISMGRFPAGPNLVVQLERMLALFLAAGLPAPIATKAGDMLSLLVEGVVLETDMWHERGIDDESDEEIRTYFAELPKERFPKLSEHGPAMFADSPESRFEVFLDVFISGLASYRQSGSVPSQQ
ncbi:TetR/AcrR family transcriptional regulator [Streptomyces albus subsp. chlorinus]|uniref:TetR/AcrR family transcriptional regulator n=1 Tax=Streptomyces albus TaxID=1888 RepID=UPI00156E6C13|nr:TetR/AcrR family transcriptional regulator [Streptomyces albus]NSC21574.1 TetR/AcrR family transcriptional regulator [Streptomyces albus subsp. chlorinus]